MPAHASRCPCGCQATASTEQPSVALAISKAGSSSALPEPQVGALTTRGDQQRRIRRKGQSRDRRLRSPSLWWSFPVAACQRPSVAVWWVASSSARLAANQTPSALAAKPRDGALQRHLALAGGQVHRRSGVPAPRLASCRPPSGQTVSCATSADRSGSGTVHSFSSQT